AHPPGIYRRDKVKNPAVPSQSVLKKWRLSALAIGSTPLERAAGLLAWLDTAGAGAASTTRIVTAPMRKLGVAAFRSGSRSSARADLAIRGAARSEERRVGKSGEPAGGGMRRRPIQSGRVGTAGERDKE